MTLTNALTEEYQTLFLTCRIRPEKADEVARVASAIVRHQSRYEAVSSATSVPWFVVGILHSLEASLNFNAHLANGDPLTARTTHVPKGRPAIGSPPFTWVESAIDALTMHKLHEVEQWTVARTLFRFEKFNGLGYRKHHPEVLSPYIFGGSLHYKAGKYVADGKWSATAVSKQIGAAVLLKALMSSGSVAEIVA